MAKAKSLVINCTTGELEYVDTPHIEKDIAEEPAMSLRQSKLDGLSGVAIDDMSGKELRELVGILAEILGLAEGGRIISQNKFPNQ